jgi:DNA repair exonuclease SbcCD ATPase subunit
MILRSLRVANWRKLEHLAIPQFSPGITVITGPNRIGKTSLTEAIEHTLIDWDYDTMKSRDVVPWNTTWTPEVEVEFEVDGASYILNKRFTKRKGGGAELYELHNGAKRLLAEGKQVTTKVQQLVGVDRADGGLAQLLWVPQGSTSMPTLDEDLSDSLRRVLGSIITGQDEAFHDTLWDRMSAAYTNEVNALAGRARSKSPAQLLRGRVDDADRQVAEIASEYARFAALREDYETAQSEASSAEAQLHRASEAAERLEAVGERIAGKRVEFQKWQGAASGLELEIAALAADAKRYAEHGEALATAEEKAGKHRAELQPLEDAVRKANEEKDAVTAHRGELDDAQEELERRQQTVGAKRRLAEIDTALKALATGIDRVAALERGIAAAEGEIARSATLTEAETSEIQTALQRLAAIEATLSAEQWVVSLEAKRPLTLRSSVDGATRDQREAAPGAVHTWEVRQQAEFDIGDVARLAVRRGQEDVQLEQLVSEHDALRRTLQERLVKSGIQETEPAQILSELSRRAALRAKTEATLDGLRAQLGREAPGGTGALKAQAELRRKERAATLAGQPGLAEWIPDQRALAEEEDAVGTAALKLREQLQQARIQEQAAEKALSRAQSAVELLRSELSSLDSAVTDSRARLDELARKHVSQAALARVLNEKREKLTEAKAEVERHRLTTEEENAAEQLIKAREAAKAATDRLGTARLRMADLQGQLRGVEGLHARRCGLEQLLSAAQRELDAVTLDLDACRLLLQLFNEVRDESVERAIEPVSALVDEWLSQLYGPEHLRVNYNTNLGVSGVTVPEGIDLGVNDATSFGEREQIAMLVRLAYGAALAKEEAQVVIIDDPLAHSDGTLHERMLNVLDDAAGRNLQVIVLTCHADRFRALENAVSYEMEALCAASQ